MRDLLDYTVNTMGRPWPVAGPKPCLCMSCPECRGYVMNTQRPVDKNANNGDWKPNRRDLKEQAEAMLVEPNEGAPAVFERDVEQPNKGRPRRTKRQTALDAINERIAKTEAKLLRLKAEREKL